MWHPDLLLFRGNLRILSALLIVSPLRAVNAIWGLGLQCSCVLASSTHLDVGFSHLPSVGVAHIVSRFLSGEIVLI